MEIFYHSVPEIESTAETLKQKDLRLYFIGIGGVSMSSLALYMKRRGAQVYGSDIRQGAEINMLSAEGIKVFPKHNADNISLCMPHAVIYSLAIDKENPEYRRAAELGITLIPRALALGAIVSGAKSSYAVSGSHGKSTTVAMMARIFSLAGRDPTVFCGADLGQGKGVLFGSDEYIVTEACEYGGSFLDIRAGVRVFLNLELDHTDCYSCTDELCEAFLRAASGAECVIINSDDKNLFSILPRINVPVVTFSAVGQADYTYFSSPAADGRRDLVIYHGGQRLLCTRLATVGAHNASNAAAAAIAAHTAGIDPELIACALSGFCGIGRRLEYLKDICGCAVYYDYAHHPTEIAALRQALRDMGKCRIGAVFAPHTYSRTEYFLDSFAYELALFDRAFIAEVYAAREPVRTDISNRLLAERTNAKGGNATVLDIGEIFKYIMENKPDALVLVGAGELEKIKKAIEVY